MMWFVKYRLVPQLSAHLVFALHKFRYQENKYDTSIFRARHKHKERVLRWLYVETRNDAEIFYQCVLLDGLNLR